MFFIFVFTQNNLTLSFTQNNLTLSNKLVYNYSSYQLPFIYPSRIEYYDGNFLNISENPYFRYKIMSIENGKGEIVDFFHNRDNVERIEISRNSVLINKILLNYSNNVI